MSHVDPNPPTPKLRRELRRIRLNELGYSDYRAYLQSARWAETRRRYRESDLPQECFCGETARIQLHHLTYERVGREELTDLAPVCPTCHAMIHALANRGVIGLDFTGFVNEQRAMQYTAALTAKAYKRQMDNLHMQAEVEDLRRMAEALRPIAPRWAKQDVWLVVSKFKRLERNLALRT